MLNVRGWGEVMLEEVVNDYLGSGHEVQGLRA